LDQGFFKKRGLDVTASMAPNPSVMISSIAAGSSDIGHTVFIPVLAAHQAGIQMAVIAGASTFPAVQPPVVGVLAGKDTGIRNPKDLEGKTVGVVGLQSYHQAMVQRWMKENGADYTKTRFVEVPFPQMQDLLKSKSVHAIVSVDPFYSKMIREGDGYDFGDFVATMPDNVPIVVFVSSRAWAEKNPDKVEAFRAALVEAGEFLKKNEAEARKSLAKYTKLPDAVIANARWGNFQPNLTPEKIQYWSNMMQEQGLLKSAISGAELLPRANK
jgi:NitT/TauT family transport system substrate-binding protein